ncbi:MAG: M20/M25/M40 family metallo-hydrolase [Bacteroidales bacterium]|jgi:carboxypeptidase PM20D1|nr:M20/M25/M40 family metallo-hydrolase [Bacteroidales bacterium]
MRYLIVSLLFLILLTFNTDLHSQTHKSAVSNEKSISISSAALMLSDYVRIPSVSGEENDAADFFARQCREMGLHVEYITNSPGEVNFAASLYPLSSNKPNIVFHNHIDVVSAGDSSLWRYPPFGGVIAEERVWGRGSFDNKGLAVIQLFAVSEFVDMAAERELPYNVTILCVSGEETGGLTGSEIVARNFNEQFNPVVVIGEGGSGMDDISFLPKKSKLFGISISEKGYLLLKLSWSSENAAGHTSITDDDYSGLRLINGLHKLLNTPLPVIMTKEAELMFKSVGKEIGGVKGKVMAKPNSNLFMRFLRKHARENPELEDIITNKITLTSLRSAHSSYNQNSFEDAAFLDCRLLPGTSPEEMINFIKETVGDSLMNMTILEQGPPVLSSHPEYYFNKLAEAVKVEFKGAKVVPMLMPASTDNSFYRAAGVPVYGFNPMIVSGDQLMAIHSYNEFIKLTDIDRGILVFKNFLNSLLTEKRVSTRRRERRD